jgi:uncharacterized membrane protein (UPF0127 family)
MLRVRNETKGVVIGDRVELAATSKARRTGLLKHSSLEAGEGLWIIPCEAVHTFGMRFAIDVVYLNKKKVVLKIRHSMVRSRMSFCLIADSVLELPAGTCEATGTTPGDQLSVEEL